MPFRTDLKTGVWPAGLSVVLGWIDPLAPVSVNGKVFFAAKVCLALSGWVRPLEWEFSRDVWVVDCLVVACDVCLVGGS